ncbi:MAG: hypothetical protein M3Z16_02675 [Pseudomonadota bacterium]|nr:hypothetical protein [Pseudomonadota bacterium]
MAIARDLNDQLIAFLNSKGYQPILLPKGGVQPPTVYILDKSRQRYEMHRSFNSLLPPGVAPLAAALESAPSFDKLQASKQHGEVSVSFMRGLLEKFGIGGAPRIDALAKADADASFTFGKVRSRHIAIGTLEDAMAQQPGAFAKSVAQKFSPDDLDSGLIHVGYEYLYSNAIEMHQGGSVTGELAMSASAGDQAEIKVGAGAHREDGEGVRYAGREPVAFAFRVAQLQRVDGAFRLRGWQSEGAGMNATDAERELYVYRTGQVFEITDASAA